MFTRTAGHVLNKRDSPRGRGQAAILRPGAAPDIAIGRLAPPESWAPLVDYVWTVRWRCAEPHVQQVIPQPVVHLAAEQWQGRPRVLVHGLSRRPFERRLVGEGQVVGAAFVPAGFRAVLRRSLAEISDRVVPLGDLLPVDDHTAARRMLEPGQTDEALATHMVGLLDAVGAEPDPLGVELARLMREIEDDPTLVRAEQVAERAGVQLRTLQRRFSEYVGIGPKWVVQRFRLLDAAAVAHAGGDVDWAGLAADLGFSDQAHLVRAFTAVVGTPPARYARDATA